MGVSGSGKTTVGRQLADATGWTFQEGDDLHPPANIAKMASGEPLTDADRAPWLAAIEARLDAWRAARASGVLTCSALKRAYRAQLTHARPEVQLVYLQGSQAAIEARLRRRTGHFMPAALLDSQFRTLEAPGPDEHVITLSIDQPPDALLAALLRGLAERRPN